MIERLDDKVIVICTNPSIIFGLCLKYVQTSFLKQGLTDLGLRHKNCRFSILDFSIFSRGPRKKIGPLSDMTTNTLGYHFSYIFRKSQ